MTNPQPPRAGGAMSWSQLTKNPWAVAGLVAAAGLGLYTLAKRNKAAGAGTSATTTGAATGGGVATLDTTGTDLASWLGNYQGSLQNTLNQFGQNIQKTLSQLPTQQPAPTIRPAAHPYPVNLQYVGTPPTTPGQPIYYPR